jgi:hypothetical protein
MNHVVMSYWYLVMLPRLMKTYFYSSKFIFTISFLSITRIFYIFFYKNTIYHSVAIAA